MGAICEQEPFMTSIVITISSAKSVLVNKIVIDSIETSIFSTRFQNMLETSKIEYEILF